MTNLELNKFINKLKNFYNIKSNNNKVGLHSPNFDQSDKNSLINCINTGKVSTYGNHVEKLEKEIKKFTGAKNVICVLNGTIGIQICLLMSNIKRDDEVLMPSLTFVSPANAIVNHGAIPHFVSINESDLGIDCEKLDKYLKKNSYKKKNHYYNKKTKRRIKGIITVDVFGHPCNFDKIRKISKKYNLEIIQDCCDALGSFYKSNHVGINNKYSVFSFNGNKIITTGAGGFIATNNSKISKKIRHLISTAKKKHDFLFVHDQIGYNYRMPAINASLGCSQMKKMKNYIKKKRELFFKYKKLINEFSFIEIFEEPSNCKSNYWLQTFVLKKGYKKKHRNYILKKLIRNGIGARACWELITTLKPFSKYPKMEQKNTKIFTDRVINLPSSFYEN